MTYNNLTFQNQQRRILDDIPVIFQVASLLAALSHPGHRVIYTLHLSSCCFVGCVHLPPHCNLKSIGYMLPGIRSLAVAIHLEIYWVYKQPVSTKFIFYFLILKGNYLPWRLLL
ncbi:hypothetical protein EAE89_09185 [Photorhabdus heterorhabditis]|nr:hypothetical protein [Photorhabdus heterorhabditis]